jgi:hypothetical protein
MKPIRVSRHSARAYVLGLQGLWPGRRWAGLDGARAALRETGAIQVDPLNAVARSHELALHARVLDYEVGTSASLLHEKREFFDYGGTVFLLPMHELPYFRVPMRRRTQERRRAAFADEHGEAIAEVRRQLAARGPLGSRDFAGERAPRENTFRSGRLSAQALYYLWITGELMTHSRRGFERIYDFRDNIAPCAHRGVAPAEEADDHFARKAIDFLGLATARLWYGTFCDFSRRPPDRADAAQRLTTLLDKGVVTPVTVEGWREPCYCSTETAHLLETVEAGDVPAAWRPVGPTSETEMTLLAPLDIVSARGRATTLFDFDYVWEVYKPADRRRFGYYTMPVLHGDRLVARIDPKLDRGSGTLTVAGVWLEEPISAADAGFLDALAHAILRLQRFVGARATKLTGPGPAALASRLRALSGSPSVCGV